MTLIGLTSQFVWALGAGGPMQWHGDEVKWDRKANRIELVGNAIVNQIGETVTAREITLDLNARTLLAKGSCVYVASDLIMYGDEMFFNIDTHTGTIIGGRVANDRYTLAGERLNRLGEGRFQTHKGVYTTCHDCPQSWSLSGTDVDIEFEGYAFMSDVTARIKDTPVFWSPYLALPLKTRRQTGFLFPKMQFVNSAFRVVQPFFWAIDRSSDMTFGVGYFGGVGHRLEWEANYDFGHGSTANANFYFVRDKVFYDWLGTRSLDPTTSRWALSVRQKHKLPWGISEQFKWVELSDQLYPTSYGDVVSGGEAYTSSDLFFSRSAQDVSGFIAFKRVKSLVTLARDPRLEHPDLVDPRVFDSQTVQALPSIGFFTNDRYLLGPWLVGGVSLGLTEFTRSGGLYDEDFMGGPKPIRKALRIGATPTLYTNIKPFDLFELTPSAQYRAFFYSFPTEISPLTRGYLLTQARLSTQIEKIYDTANPEIPKIKHLVRPYVTYSLIPHQFESNQDHPFLNQIEYARKNQFTGYQFDNYDIVPIDSSYDSTNYFAPLGNSLTFGLNTQLVRRRGLAEATNPSYQRFVELQSSETVNLQEVGKTDGKPFSQFQASGNLKLDKVEFSVEYSYLPYLVVTRDPLTGLTDRSRNIWAVSGKYVLESATHNRIYSFERSLTLGYNFNRSGGQTDNIRLASTYSLNDYLMPTAGGSFDIIGGNFLSVDLSMKVQSPAKCYSFSVGFSRTPTPPEVLLRNGPDAPKYSNTYTFDFTFNLTGSGFSGITEVSDAVIK